MKLIFSVYLLCLTSHLGLSQSFATNDPAYVENVTLGQAAMESMKYDSCITYYQTAFKLKQTSYLSTMRAAACGFSAMDVNYLDQELAKAFELNWGGAKQVFDNYPEFSYLKGTVFEDMVINAHEDAAIASGADLGLMEEFQTIRYEDQRYRQEMREVGETYGRQSPQMDSLWVLQNKADAINTERIIEVIEERGYPGKSVVGPGMASTAFLVIQHADLEIQEKYLKTITDAADAGEVNWSSVALLVDRINTRNDRAQIYGSQVSSDKETGESFFFEIAEPYKIDSVRATVGLGPLSEYAKFFDFEWDPDKHVERYGNK